MSSKETLSTERRGFDVITGVFKGSRVEAMRTVAPQFGVQVIEGKKPGERYPTEQLRLWSGELYAAHARVPEGYVWLSLEAPAGKDLGSFWQAVDKIAGKTEG